MYDRNVKSKRIPNQIACAGYLRQNRQISEENIYCTSFYYWNIDDKIFSFQYSVTYCSQALRRPAHRARKTVHLLTHETQDFITPALWPANSPDLNPVDYQIWWKLQDRVYRSQICDVDQLKSLLIEEWEHFHQVVIDQAVRQWRPCLRVCVWAHGGHFEHRL